MLTADLPAHLLSDATELEADLIVSWWSSLPAAVRQELAGLFDPRADETAWSSAERDAGGVRWQALPIQLRGRLVDEETRPETRMLKQQLFDYIVNHEDVRFFLEDRSYHICREHRAARDVLRTGYLPATFRCPLARGDCPMRAVLVAARGQSVAFAPVESPVRPESPRSSPRCDVRPIPRRGPLISATVPDLMSIEIAEYGQSDLDEVVRVWRAASAIAHTFQSQADLDRDEGLIRGQYMHHTESWCARADGALVGFLSLMDTRVVALFVDPARQRGGVGSRLMDRVNELRGPLSVEVFADNAIAVPFYRQHQFEYVRDQPSDLYPGEVLWLMAQPGAPEPG